MPFPKPENEHLTRTNDLKLVFLLVVAVSVAASTFIRAPSKSPFGKQPSTAAAPQKALAANAGDRR